MAPEQAEKRKILLERHHFFFKGLGLVFGAFFHDLFIFYDPGKKKYDAWTWPKMSCKRTSPRIPKLVTEFPFFFSGGIKLLLLSVVAMRSVFFLVGVGTSNGRQKNAPFLVAFFFLGAGFEGVGWNHLGYSAFQELLWDVIFGYFRCLAAWFHYSSESFTVLKKNKSKGFLEVHPFTSLIPLPETNEYPNIPWK